MSLYPNITWLKSINNEPTNGLVFYHPTTAHHIITSYFLKTRAQVAHVIQVYGNINAGKLRKKMRQ